MKMKERNGQLKNALGAMAPKKRIQEVASIPAEDTVNRQGCKAYSLSDELRLISMLNTLKIEPQYYRSENDTIKELRDLVERIGLKDPYFLCQAIVWSRCMGEGMRSINHLAAALAAPFIAGQPYAKAFYGLFNKKEQVGGCIYRPDDMAEIKDVWAALNTKSDGKMIALANAMKKGFASALENLDTYSLAKYKDSVIDITNLVHPRSKLSLSTVVINGKKMKTLDALMQGITVSADTHEVANSEAGQVVAAAVKAGKITKDEAVEVLAEAKNDNWEALLDDDRLGILAALRNIRNMMKSPRKSVIDKLCKKLSDGEALRKGKVMPYQIDTAYEVINEEMPNNEYAHRVMQALLDGYEKSVPNLALALPGKTCVMVDCSGSMHTSCYMGQKRMRTATACGKAGLIAATIAKATGADVVRFGSSAEMYKYNKTLNVFKLGEMIANSNMGGTSIAAAFDLIRRNRLKYDRIIILSDNECNSRGWGGSWTSGAYKNYVHDVTSPYVYAVDLAAYGTVPLKNDGKVNYYFGYGYSMFTDIASREFNPAMHIEKIRKVVIDPNYKG
jgi:polyhydroxyalkanoate synthesis regulator phasin